MSSRRLALFAIVLLAGCGLDDVSQGVEVVTVSGVGGDAAADADAPLRVAPSGGGDLAAEAVTAGGESAEPALADAVPAPMPASVVVIGDSLTLAAADEIDVALTQLGLVVLEVDGIENRRMVRGGRDLPPGVDAIADALDAGLAPELWIIALGTNDVGSDVSPESFGSDVAAVLATVPAGAPVIWVDLWIRNRSDAVAEANRTIRSITALRPATRVVDWYSHGDDPGIISGDGIHLTDSGERLFAASMAAAVDTMFAS